MELKGVEHRQILATASAHHFIGCQFCIRRSDSATLLALMEASWVEQLSARSGEAWLAITHARTRTEELLDKLRKGLEEFDDPNCSIVVTGSLGRGEASETSDADWMMIVDGQSNPDHAPIAHQIAKRIADLGFKKPGRTATFGDLVSSHELIHYIAGTHDSNTNLTRRILLLCESRALTRPLVRERVIRNILARYVVHDPSIRTTKPPTMSLFLVNDVVRYWRTIASDYASKMWERQKEEWAIRNVKLRFSRKLLFAGGLIIAFAGELVATEEATQAVSDEERRLRLAELIREQTNVAPLDLSRTCASGIGQYGYSSDRFRCIRLSVAHRAEEPVL